MDEKELRTRLLEKAIAEIHDAVFEWGVGEDGYRDAKSSAQTSASRGLLGRASDDVDYNGWEHHWACAGIWAGSAEGLDG